LGSQGPAGNTTFQSAGRGLIRTQMVYDGNSRMIQMIDDRGATTDYTFDTLDRQITMVYADGSTENFAYNNASNLITFTDCNGSIFTNTWDCMGRKTAVAIAPAPGLGGTTSQSFQYDGLSRQTSSSDTTPTGTVQVAKVFDSLGRTLEEAPNTQGLVRYLTNAAFTSYPPTQFTYPNGRRQVNWTYDLLYRRQSCTDPAVTPAVTIASWNYLGPSRVAEVSLNNQAIIQTMLNNARTSSAVQSSVPNPVWGTQSSDRLGYDGAGRMITRRYLTGGINGSTYAYNNTSALVGQTTAYDHGGNKFYERSLQAIDRSNLYQPVDNSGNIASPAPGYDSANRLLQYQRGELNSTGGYQNNGGGSVGSPIGLPNTDQSRSYTLDGLGNWKKSAYTAEGATSAADTRNNNYVNQITQRTLAGSAPSALGYDRNGNTGTAPAGPSYAVAVVASGPALYWRLDETGGTTAADLSGNGDDGTYSTGVNYGQPGALLTSANMAVGFPGTGSVVNQQALNFSNTTVAAWVKLAAVPTKDAQMIAGFAQAAQPQLSAPAINTSVLYVDTSGNANWVVNDGTTAYTVASGPLQVGKWYFLVGTADGTTSTLYVNGSLAASTSAGSSQVGFVVPNFLVDGNAGFYGGALNAVVDEVAAYDFALTAQQIAGLYSVALAQPQVEMQYDALNRLIAVNRVSDGAAIAAYVYDAMNRRVRKTVTNGGLAGNIPNGTTDSCWLGWQTMEERNPYGGSGSTDTPTKQYVWGTYIDECLQLNLLAVAGPQQLAIGVYYPLQDTLYRTMALANSSGAVVEAYDTDAYGNTIIFTGPGADKTWFTDDDTQSSYGANDIIYCGYRYDAETENYYVRNRYYSPTLGRWLTRDPIGYRGGINLYGYVNSSPVGNVDAEGSRSVSMIVQLKGKGFAGTADISYQHGVPGNLVHFAVAMEFNHADFLYATLNGAVRMRGEISANWTGNIRGHADLTVDFPQWFIPNAKLNTIDVTVEATVRNTSKCGCEAVVGLSGSPSNWLLGLLFWDVHARGTATDDTPCNSLSAGISGLVMKAASELHLSAKLLGFIPLGFGLPAHGAFRRGPSLGKVFKAVEPLSLTVHFDVSNK
jgi:RHS repeat-associated protein